MHKTAIDTPALLLDMDVVETNIRTMADYFEGRPCRLRPHAKTHKLPLIARKQIEAGAIGVACATLKEAEAMLKADIDSVLIANQIVGQAKIDHLVQLAPLGELIVCVDDVQNAEEISRAAVASGLKVGVLVEINVGLGRCGVAPGQPVLELARGVADLKGLEFKGLMGYEGGVFVKDPVEKEKKCLASNRLLVDNGDLLRKNGIEVEILSAGGSNTYTITGNAPGITEVQPGSYVTMDSHNLEFGVAFGQAITVLATVISVPEAGKAVVDTGLKALSTDRGLPTCLDPGFELFRLNEEHGYVRFKRTDLRPGDTLEIIPSHGCTTIPLFAFYHLVRAGQVCATEAIVSH